MVHLTTVYELSSGCSVGCWFCAVSAKPLSGVFHYTEQNATLWRGIQLTMKEILGPSAGAGICYWATEPFDNPDYEEFCTDFAKVHGLYPQTTTAMARRDPERTRTLLRDSQALGCRLNRFSVLSLGMLNKLHKEFTAEELRNVRLTTFSRTSHNQGIAVAGRAARNRKKDRYRDYSFAEDATIACASGFIFNMVERDIKLISPCLPREKWPLGYQIFAHESFRDADDVRRIVLGMIAEHMPTRPREDRPIRFRDDLCFKELPGGFEVTTRMQKRRFDDSPYLAELGRLIHTGDQTVEDLRWALSFYMVPPKTLQQSLQTIFDAGVLDEAYDPSPEQADVG